MISPPPGGGPFPPSGPHPRAILPPTSRSPSTTIRFPSISSPASTTTSSPIFRMNWFERDSLQRFGQTAQGSGSAEKGTEEAFFPTAGRR